VVLDECFVFHLVDLHIFSVIVYLTDPQASDCAYVRH